MTILEELVEYCKSKYPEKWEKALARFKHRYEVRKALEELVKEEQILRHREKEFLRMEKNFFKRFFQEAVKRGDKKTAALYAAVLKKL